MMFSILADGASSSWNPFESFGVTGWEPFVASLIAFGLMVLVLRLFAFKPIQQMLDLRRERIQEGEQMREESARKLASVQKEAKEILTKATQEGQEQVEYAKANGARILAEKEAEASRSVQDIMARAHEAADLETKQAREELKGEFTRLVAQATAQVTGKVLNEEDHRRINRELIDKINS
jgi:F-type H+-transporting ATPase subunit b